MLSISHIFRQTPGICRLTLEASRIPLGVLKPSELGLLVIDINFLKGQITVPADSQKLLAHF